MNSPSHPTPRKRIVIVGRPNVGKSTLFNRLFGRKRALVHNLPGVTRDRLEEKVDWAWGGKNYEFSLVDTGGLGGDRFAAEIKDQVNQALEGADLLLVVWDVQSGFTPADRQVLQEFQRAGVLKRVPAIGIVNKVDSAKHEDLANEFYESGIEPILTVSAEHDRGTDELRNLILEKAGIEPVSVFSQDSDDFEELEETEEPEAEEGPKTPRIAIVGRPNVGKSTLVNAILGERRMITSPIAGTTVDAVDSLAEIDRIPVVLIDTAGIRRKSKTEQGVEVLSVVQARKALERADIALLVLDGETGITDQDEKIGGLIEEAGKSLVLVINKWDTQSKNPEFSKQDAAERIRKQMAFLKYAPIVFMSALRGTGLKGLGELIEEILRQRAVKLTTHEFTEWVRREVGVHNPMNAKFYLCHQSGRHPPTFVLHVSDPEKVHFSLKRHLVNGIRDRWGYMGTPIRLVFVQGRGGKGRE